MRTDVHFNKADSNRGSCPVWAWEHCRIRDVPNMYTNIHLSVCICEQRTITEIQFLNYYD